MIAEPVTTITDLILAIQGFAFGHLLFWKYSQGKAFIMCWAFTFFFLGFAALFGAIAHGAAPYETMYPWLKLTWPATIFCIVTTSFFLYMSLIEEFFSKQKKVLTVLVGIISLFFYLHIFGVLNVLNPDGRLSFMVAILSYAPAMFLHLVLNVLGFLKSRKMAYSLMANGIILSFFGTLIQMFKIAPHEHFNHNDLYHVIQMIALFLIYKGLKQKTKLAFSVNKGGA